MFVLYEPSKFDGIEDLEQYTAGGLCPVHLGDTFRDGRFEIIHKLGYGGSSTVWLAHDSQTGGYKALKILRADSSANSNELDVCSFLQKDGPEACKFLLLPSDNFSATSANGTHLCLAFDVAGAPVTKFGRWLPNGRLDANAARDFSLQATNAMAYLHSRGIGHGDFTPRNLLLQLHDLNAFSKEEVMSIFGRVYEDVLYTRAANKSQGPRYVVEPAEATNIPLHLMDSTVQLIDFGESFRLSEPLACGLGIPFQYCAPEIMFGEQAGAASDIWSLACTIFEIRAGQPLFETFLGNKHEVLAGMVELFGKLPERWWVKWEKRKDYFDRDGDDLEIDEESERPLLQGIKLVGNTVEGQTGGESAEPLTDEEAECFANLLENMLKYEPEERCSIMDVVKHPWFVKSFGE